MQAWTLGRNHGQETAVQVQVVLEAGEEATPGNDSIRMEDIATFILSLGTSVSLINASSPAVGKQLRKT